MVAEPPPPNGVIRPALGDHRPEPWPVTEHPQVGELVDDDRLEGFGRGQDEPPGEGQPAFSRGAPPARPLIADADRGGRHLERGGMVADRAFDLRPSARLEPRFEDGRSSTSVGGRDPDDNLVTVDAADPLDSRPACAVVKREEPEPVEVAAEPERSAVAQAASCEQGGTFLGVPVQVTAQPRLPLGKEGTDMPLGVGPAAATRRRDGDDHAAVGMDDHAQAAGSR